MTNAQASSVAARSQRPGLATMPVIVDTVIGHRPDDAVALTMAARLLPVSLVVTADELRHGNRARLARFQMNLLGRPGVPVVAGGQLPAAETRWFADGIVSDDTELHTDSFLESLDWVMRNQNRPLHWVVSGPATNLAWALQQRPGLAERLVVTWAVGERHMRLDPGAAVQVLRSRLLDLSLVLVDSVPHPGTGIGPGSRVYHALQGQRRQKWATVVRNCYDQSFNQQRPGMRLEAPLAVVAATGRRIVACEDARFDLSDDGRIHLHPNGDHWARIATDTTYRAINDRVTTLLALFGHAGGYAPDLLDFLGEQQR
ncbi:nucleoside hydrolase [Nocardia sp. NPDC050710]|uniref:nucleoside hydrolase n=1 Tax=Nocardia sp. NPDC050710 TaxID=3157220 RepID=UPI0033CC3B5D